jgi:co-chaperonin GroES (HSP10)
MTNNLLNSYQSSSKVSKNSWITDPNIVDPDNLPVPLGWCLLVRPYPITQNTDNTGLLMPENEIDFLNHVTNIGRVVAVGPSCWTRPEHRNAQGEFQPWAKVGDFVSFPKNVGARRKFKGVSYVLLVDDEIVEYLPDPQVFDNGYFTLNIPKEHLEKYNTIYKKEGN